MVHAGIGTIDITVPVPQGYPHPDQLDVERRNATEPSPFAVLVRRGGSLAHAITIVSEHTFQRCIPKTGLSKWSDVRGSRSKTSLSTVTQQARPPQHSQTPSHNADPERRSDAAQALSDLSRPLMSNGQRRDSSVHHTSTSTSSVPPAQHSTPNNRFIAPNDWHHTAKADGLATLAAKNDTSIYGPSSTVAFLRHVMPGQSSGTATPHEGTFDSRSSSEPRRESILN